MKDPEAEAIRAKQKHQEELLKVPGVIGAGVGEATDEKGVQSLCIRIYVKRITDELQAAIPKTIEGFPTSIIEVGSPGILLA